MEYFHKLKLLSFAVLLSIGHLYSDINVTDLWSAYVRGDVNKVLEAKAEILSERSSDMRIIFFKTLFEPDAEAAFSVYQKIISSTNDGELRYQAAKKIYEYYYAKGFYVTADEFKSRFGLDKEVVVGDKPVYSDTDYNIFSGWRLKGWPRLTMLRGKVVMEEGKIYGQAGQGNYLPSKSKG